MRMLLPTVLLTAGLACPAAAQVLYVDANIPAPGNGSTWAQAFKDLQPALAAATPGTEVWVASGFYTNPPYSVPAGVTVKGRYLPGHSSDLQREVNNQTVLFGNNTSRLLTMGAGSVVDGLSLQAGQAGAPGGGAVLIDGVACKIRNCFFLLNNDSVGAGAAVLVRNGADPRIESCVFYLNGDAQSGAAIDVDGASGTFVNLTIDTSHHSGIRLRNGATPAIHNSILSNNGNVSGAAARGIEQVDTGANPPAVEHCLFFNNRTSLYRHGASELTTVAQVNGLPFASNNLSGDPQFTVPLAVYTVPVTSPAVDAGGFVFPEVTQGIYDNGRVMDGNLDGIARIDIGAYEYADVTLRIPKDIHLHVHMNAASKSGRPIFLIMSAGPSPIPGGILVQPFGHVFIDLTGAVVFPLPAGNVINYPPGVPGGVFLYLQAFTTNFVGLGFSNPAVHVTNCCS